LVATIAAAALLLHGCGGGDDGATGPAGSAGPAGTPGAAGPNATTTVKVASLSAAAWADLAPQAVVTKVTIASPPVVEFKVTDAAGNPVVGLADNTSKSSTATVTGYTNVAFALAKLVPGTNGSPSKWVNYAVFNAPTVAQKAGTVAASASCDSTTSPTWCAGRPTTDNQGTLVDNGDGSYKYTFLRDITKAKDIVATLKDAADGSYKNVDAGDLTYDPNLTHRLVIQISGAARGTGSNTANGVTVTPTVAMKNPANAIYDFIPATGKAAASTDTLRNIVDTANCNECHGKLQALGFHGGARSDARFCVVCHTDQRKYGTKEATTTATGYSGSTSRINGLAVGDFPAFIHRLHRGSELVKTGYNYANVLFNDVVYPMQLGSDGQKMCSKCHAKTATAPQGDNWNAVPSRMACGSCHDGIDFATGAGTTNAGATTGHGGGAKADDKTCSTCHAAADIKTYHMTENVTPHNPTVKAGLQNFTYEIASASVNATTNAVTVKFRIKADGTAVTLAAPTAAMANPLAGFTGGPSFLLAYAMSQDGVTTPVDYNNLGRTNAQPISVSLANLLDSNRTTTTGTLSARDADGYYTANIVGTAVVFPVGAKLRTVALQGYFTQVSPAAARHTVSVVKGVTGDTARRVVVDPAKCGNCHEWFEGHGGNRVYETQVCVTCHNPGINSTGRGISDAALAAYNFSADDNAKLTAWGFNKTLPNAAVNLPVTTNNFKDMIHGIHAGKDRVTPFVDARDRTPSAITLLDMSKGAFPNILSNCESACHKPGTYSSVPTNTLASTYEYNNGTVPMTPAAYKLSFVQPNATDKVTTPFAASCVSCHDATTAQAHMQLNGAQIKVNRSALALTGESCALCHAAGKEFDPVKVHANLK
jgi:OmcA/MtrC family decaheme c-type cytochrome